MAEAAAEAFLRDYPELRPFVLTDVQLTGTRIGCGAFGNVDEVAVPVVAAAKTIHAILQEGDGTGIVPKALTEYVRECQLMSTLRHPNIVQFLGVAFFRNSRLPALVMERLLTSIHDLLDPQEAYPPPPPDTPTALSFFTMDLKVSVLHDVACGLAYLHEQLPPIIHRDLSARNILLNTKMVAKITDLGVACIMPRMRAATNLSVGPGAIVYMPPEVFNHSGERSKYDASIDIFAFGVVTIFTIGENFPCDILPPTYVDEKSGLVRSRTELQRRSEYMRDVNDQLRARGQLRGDHPLIRLIQQCLQNVPAKRPGIREVLHQLEDARAGFRDKTSERNKRELIRALQMHPIKHVRKKMHYYSLVYLKELIYLQNLEHILEDLVVDNADIHSRLQTMEKELQNKVAQMNRFYRFVTTNVEEFFYSYHKFA